jgi:hypothetical protein
VEIRLFGAMEVVDDAQAWVAVSGTKLLLAALGHPTEFGGDLGATVDELWGSDAPALATDRLVALL